MLERWLARAKEGRLNYAAIAVCQYPDLVANDFTGSVDMELAMDFTLAKLRSNVQEAREKRLLPPRDPTLGADYVCYNLNQAPLSFDLLPWLIDAEMTRVRLGAPAPLKVGFAREAEDEQTESRNLMLDRLARPMLKLLGAVEDERALLGRNKEVYVYGHVTHAVKHLGEKAPILQASDEAMYTVAHSLIGWSEPPPVVITLREAQHWPHRNSNMKAWLKFADRLKADGERVIIVRDTQEAEVLLEGYTTYPEASKDLDIRMALYEQAKINLFVANGPWNLALFGTRPWLMFNAVSSWDVFFPNTPLWWTKYQGISEGEQFPWSRTYQRIIWKADDYDILCRAWDDFYNQKLEAA